MVFFLFPLHFYFISFLKLSNRIAKFDFNDNQNQILQEKGPQYNNEKEIHPRKISEILLNNDHNFGPILKCQNIEHHQNGLKEIIKMDLVIITIYNSLPTNISIFAFHIPAKVIIVFQAFNPKVFAKTTLG